jgi:methylated-DNA-[protein]-cysteine S-methyltransferase
MTVFYCRTDSPVGVLTLTSDGSCLTGLFMENHKGFSDPDSTWILDESAAPFGILTEFTVPLHISGTDFQMRVWQELRNIPFGEVISYAELARRIDNPKACRAVGLANGLNPISIIVPCHRVIGANGKLTGYGGGLPRKEKLLNIERPNAARQLSLV